MNDQGSMFNERGARLSLALGFTDGVKTPDRVADFGEATELRQRVAHGVSRGFRGRRGRAAERRQNVRAFVAAQSAFCRPSGARTGPPLNPRLTPWATLWRNSVAAPQSAKWPGVLTQPVKLGAKERSVRGSIVACAHWSLSLGHSLVIGHWALVISP